MTNEKRFWEKVRKTDDCWLWVGHKNTMTGVGLYAVSRGDFREAHIYSWELENGPMPEPETRQVRVVEQTCKKPNCVRPDHLLVIFGKNKDELEKERKKILLPSGLHPNSNEARSQRTHCINGHEYTEQNTIRRKNTRRCRTCKNEQSKQRRLRQKQAKEDFQNHFGSLIKMEI